MVFTIFCCGTCSNRYDAYGALERDGDEWDKDYSRVYMTFEASNFHELFTHARGAQKP